MIEKREVTQNKSHCLAALLGKNKCFRFYQIMAMWTGASQLLQYKLQFHRFAQNHYSA